MCLAIPGKIVELIPDLPHLGVVEVTGVRRRVDLGLLADEPPAVGDWVLIHVGFAMSKISEQRGRGSDADARHPRRGRGRDGGSARLRPGGEGAVVRFVDEFRDPDLIARTAEEIRRLADPARHYRLMEVCGGHTHAIYRFGLKDVLPANIELIHGPGCPVCVLPMGRIDDGLSLAREPRGLHRVRRHDAGARHARQPARAQGPRAWTSASSTRRPTRSSSRAPIPTGT